MAQDLKTFRWIDFAMIGGASSIPTFCLIYAINYGVSGQPLAMLSVVTASFWGIYALYLYHRKQFINTITFITKQDVGIITNGFDVKQLEVESEIDEAIKNWNIACNFDRSAKALDGALVSFKTFPVQDRTVLNLAGFTIGNSCTVGYKPDLKQTAFQHELGHILHKEYSGVYDNEACHKFMKDHNLP